MSSERSTAKIRLTIAELTVANGETTGSVEMSITENGRTETVRREIGRPAKTRRAKPKAAPRPPPPAFAPSSPKLKAGVPSTSPPATASTPLPAPSASGR